MREKFKGYYRPTEGEENSLWANAIVVMDTNVVLDLYKYHKKTTNLYLESLAKFRQQLWLPYQVALEFHVNRPGVRADSTKAHKERIADLQKVQNKIQTNAHKSKLATSKVELELVAKASEAIAALQAELETITAESHVNAPDQLLDRISELFEGRIGDMPSEEDMKQMTDDAADRFDRKVPPGYEDRGKKPVGEEYGDYFLWRQVMDYAKASGLNVIFATEDSKLDWWWKVNGNDIVGPRPELIQEFRSETGRDIIFYSGRGFFQQLTERAKAAKNAADLHEALADVKAVSDDRQSTEAMEEERDRDQARETWLGEQHRGMYSTYRPSITSRIVPDEYEYSSIAERERSLRAQLEFTLERLNYEENRRRRTEARLNKLISAGGNDDNSIQIRELKRRIKTSDRQLAEYTAELRHIKNKIAHLEYETLRRNDHLFADLSIQGIGADVETSGEDDPRFPE